MPPNHSELVVAVVDRVEDAQWLILLVGDCEREWVLPLSIIEAEQKSWTPPGSWGWLSFTERSGHHLQSLLFTPDPALTAHVRSRLATKLEKLRHRRSFTSADVSFAAAN